MSARPGHLLSGVRRHPPAAPSGTSRWLDIGGPVRYLDFGGPARGPLMVCVHGLGGSAVNWAAIAPLLTDRFRVIAPDLAGHGLTRSAGRGCDVAANRVLLHSFLASVSAEPVILMGNSMGGMIALLEASAAPERVSRLILVDPALPFVPAWPSPVVASAFAIGAIPWIGRAVIDRASSVRPETLVATVLALCCADPARVPADVVAMHVTVAAQRAGFPGVGLDMSAAARSVIATAASSEYRDQIRAVSCPVLLLHGDRDRLVPVSAARAAAQANPSWSLAILRGIGHVPQLEAARASAAIIGDWLRDADPRPGRRASSRQRPQPAGVAARGVRRWRPKLRGAPVHRPPRDQR